MSLCWQGVRTPRGVVVFAVACALICAGCGATGNRPNRGRSPRLTSVQPVAQNADHGGSFSFGDYAGYVWAGAVNSVQASWTIPAVLVRSRPGWAGTWIGAQARSGGRTSDVPFIQVGTNEERHIFRGEAHNIYYAFWTDTTHHFRAIALFLARPGDAISASLRLARGTWIVSITDETSGTRKHFTTRDVGDASFDEAEWLQEDPHYQPTHPFPYPRLAPLHMWALSVNSGAPRYSDVRSVWMSANGRYLAPTPLRHDSFGVLDAKLTAADRRYLSVADALDRTTLSFDRRFDGWTPRTPGAEIASEMRAYSAALQTSYRSLAASPWPPGARPRILALVHRGDEISALMARARPDGSVYAWRLGFVREMRPRGAALNAAAQLVRRALGLPEIPSIA